MEKTNCKVIGLDVKSFMEAGAGGRETKKKKREEGTERVRERHRDECVFAIKSQQINCLFIECG